MNILSGFVLYALIWWTVIFLTLPFGIKAPEKPTTGHMHGAPVAANLKKKVIVTTILSFILWLGLNPLLHRELAALRDDAHQMAIEDEKK